MPDLHQELTELLAKGDKIAAIKRMREEFGFGLADAKAAVGRFEAGEGLPQPRSAASEGLPDEVLALARAGRKLEAITLLRQGSGLDLFEAKRRVDSVEPVDAAGGPRAKRSGCAGSVLCVLLVGSCWLALL